MLCFIYRWETGLLGTWFFHNIIDITVSGFTRTGTLPPKYDKFCILLITISKTPHLLYVPSKKVIPWISICFPYGININYPSKLTLIVDHLTDYVVILPCDHNPHDFVEDRFYCLILHENTQCPSSLQKRVVLNFWSIFLVLWGSNFEINLISYWTNTKQSSMHGLKYTWKFKLMWFQVWLI